uniref:RNA helicase n=1 Tax=Elaeis guineensis var. tenera TaxID=51953 RepID=A0A6J0PMU3_ELAGV|nr:DExH-box ATP-dependent RNA helicase DExH7, chloroplastic isoform X2 [Elaeis guineensis]
MPPKRRQQQKAKAKSDAKPAPKLQISADNERRLRRLLLNTERPAPPPAAAPAPADTASRAQKAKRLRSIYDKLSLEGFSSDQIEQALSALKEGATFETALDWLCFNIPGNELPLKFSSGVSSSTHEGAERSVKIISTARDDWVPQQRLPDETKKGMPGVSIVIKAQRSEESLDLGKSSHKDWIRQYMEQQEDKEQQEDEEQQKQEDDPNSRAASIAKEYHHAMLGAVEAKRKGDKKSQDQFGKIISKLKQELSILGLSHDILMSGPQDGFSYRSSEEISCDSTTWVSNDSKTQDSAGDQVDFAADESKQIVNTNISESFSLKEIKHASGHRDKAVSEDGESNEEQELELDNLFSEDLSSGAALPTEFMTQQKNDKLPQFIYGHSLGNIDEIWKKGDPGRIPKAILQKLCQKLGWEPPKYGKLSEKGDKFLYSVSVLRTATGRGKSRKAGGLITIQPPNLDEAFGFVEDAQNKVAAFALCQLFPDLPLSQMLREPYSSFVSKWQKDELSTKLEDSEDIRRAGFVDSLLNVDTSQPMISMDSNILSDGENMIEPQKLEGACDDPSGKGMDSTEEAASIYLQKELESKMKLPKYMKMLEARAALPIAKLKDNFLHLLKDNDVIVVCGETGCGKTTQVPQFILDDMINSGLGGCCNIVCTQPRRLAAISVAERVSDERCESSPGSNDSLVGYQVRLDSARNEKTRLLFCTTGILLRKLAGNKDLAGITHVIVDEVHERSLLGDFLLIVLKDLIGRQASHRRQKLKVVLMSATVDSSLFSRYFGDCPVITAEGRTHPVSTYFLEDVYEKLEYHLPSDSPASGTFLMPNKGKPGSSSVDNRRGKKNLVLSSWGDESLLFEDYVNPCYIPDFFECYSEQTRQNLKRLNEDVIDFDVLEDLISYIDENYPPGAILVFLPGVAEIDLLVDKLTASFRFGGVSSDWVLPLHSSLASTDQRKVFVSPPQNIRKVIVATDIAETSITIDDVVYVVDTGRHKENRYNPHKKMSSIVEDWISWANAKQRRGRAGRVKPGICFCLYTRYRFEKLMRPFQVPEMLRMPLTELCLQIKSLSLGDIKSFLLKAIETPREDVISSAIDLLYKVGAFQGDEVLSPLGYHLAKLPVDVLIGKMMLYGAVFGCLSPILSIAAFLSYKFPFVYPKDEKQYVERAKSALLSESLDNILASNEENKESDHLLMVVAYNKWARILRENGAKAAQRFCRSYFLNSSVMYMIRDMRIQFGSLLADIGLINLPKLTMSDGRRKDKLDSWFADMSQPFNMYACHSSVIKSIVCAGLYPNVAATREGIVGASLSDSKAPYSSPAVKDRPIWSDGRREVHIHPSSVNHNAKGFQYPFLAFLEKVETSKVFLRDTTIISPYSILLFGGSMVIQHQRATFVNNEVVKSIVHLLLEEDKAQQSLH